MTGSPPDLDGNGIDELRRLLIEALERIAALTAENAALREEIARLKGLKGRPKIPPSKPSGMERASVPPAPRDKGRRGRSKSARLVLAEDCIVTAEVPAGSRFKGYEIYLVQDLEIRARVIRYRRERWLTPDGKTVVAPLPAGRNGHFAWFGTTGSKSRLNFLELLRAGHEDYVINAEALAYMRERHLAGPVIARLAGTAQTRFADRTAWQAHLDRLGLSALRVTPDPVSIATEGALWGSVKAHGFLPATAIVSDDAGQFDVGQHGL